MLGLADIKGTLRPGADADLVVLDDKRETNVDVTLRVDEVWKFGGRVYCRESENAEETRSGRSAKL